MFRFFRRYQKSFLVVAGVLLMLVFTIGDPLSQMLGPGGSGGGGSDGNDVAVKWDGGQLTEMELDRLKSMRYIASQFQQTVELVGRQASPEGVPLQTMVYWTNPESPTFEEDTARTHMLAEEARRMGMDVSDAAITNYLAKLGRNQLGAGEMRAIIDDMSSGRGPITVEYLYNAIREEMLGRMILDSYRYAYSSEMPQQRYESWLRTNDQAIIEAAAIKATDSLVDVGEPTDKQLRELFEEFKEREPSPVIVLGVELPSPDPGFRIPRKVALNYLHADPEAFREQIAAEITDEEVAKYYEDNKAFYIKSELDEEAAADEASTESTTDASPEAGAADSADEPSTEAARASDESPATDTPAATQAEPDAEAPAATPEETTEGEPQSANSGTSPFRLVALQSDESAAEQNATEDNSNEDTAESAAAPDADQAADDSGDASDEAVEGEDTDAAADATSEPAKPIEYQPLEEVADEIRKSIADERVVKKIEDVTTEVMDYLTGEFRKYEGTVLDAEAKGNEAPEVPATLTDLSSLAAKFNLAYEKTAPLSGLELRDDTEVGKSIELQRYFDPEGGRAFTVTQVVFGGQFELYEPIQSGTLEGDGYISIKVSDEPARTPSFDEVKPQVTLAWKGRQAAEKALDRAKELAKRIEADGVNPKDFFADQSAIEVVEPVAFPWFTAGDMAPTSMSVSYRLSQPEGIVGAGPEFMEAIFKASIGDVLAVQNYDHSIAYVVKVKSHLESAEQLRESFLAETEFWQGRETMFQGNRQRNINLLRSDIFADKNIEWLRTPDQRRSEEEQAAASDEEAAEDEA